MFWIRTISWLRTIRLRFCLLSCFHAREQSIAKVLLWYIICWPFSNIFNFVNLKSSFALLSSNCHNFSKSVLLKKYVQYSMLFRACLFQSFYLVAACPCSRVAAWPQIKFLSTSIMAAWPRGSKYFELENWRKILRKNIEYCTNFKLPS